jgi:hypothetical protein
MTHFIKYKDEIINLNLVALITKTNKEKNLGFDYYWKGVKINNYIPEITDSEIFKNFQEGYDYLINFDNIKFFIFNTKKERDDYFLKIQERIEKIQGFKIDLGEKND